jgi:hypothetical protein
LAGYPSRYPASGLTGYPAGYPAVLSSIRPDTGYHCRIKKRIIRPDIQCIPRNYLYISCVYQTLAGRNVSDKTWLVVLCPMSGKIHNYLAILFKGTFSWKRLWDYPFKSCMSSKLRYANSFLIFKIAHSIAIGIFKWGDKSTVWFKGIISKTFSWDCLFKE